MNGILEFIKDYYIVFIVISIFLVLALIGFFADKFTNKDVKIGSKDENDSVESL